MDQARALLKEFDDFEWDYEPCPPFQLSRIITKQLATIERLTPSGSIYRRRAESAVAEYGPSKPETGALLIGVLEAIVDDHKSGFALSVEEIVHADLFNDFLEMAQYLLNEGFKDPAAVLTGGVLEEQLRKLCQRNGLSITVKTGTIQRPKKADAMNSELAAAKVYGKLDQKNVTAWLDLRNQAAHGHYDNYAGEQVVLMLQGIREFLLRRPA